MDFKLLSKLLEAGTPLFALVVIIIAWIKFAKLIKKFPITMGKRPDEW